MGSNHFLYFASKYFTVEQDPVVDQIDQLLPQTQCGQCGFPGCKPYAQSIAEGDAITFTEYAGTDSAAITLGIISITNNILNITVSDDSSCTVITASKL